MSRQDIKDLAKLYFVRVVIDESAIRSSINAVYIIVIGNKNDRRNFIEGMRDRQPANEAYFFTELGKFTAWINGV